MHILLTTYGLLLIFALFCTAQWRSATDMAFMDAVAIERFTKSRNRSLAQVTNQARKLHEKHSPTPQKASSKAISSQVDSTTAADTNALIIDENEDEEPALDPPDMPDDEKDKPDKKVKNRAPKKCTSYLHVHDIFMGENPTITEGKGKSAFILLKNLIAALYSGQDFFEAAKDKIPDLEEQFVQSLYESAKDSQTEEQWLLTFKNLDQLELDDKTQTDLRYKAFTGNKRRLDKESSEAPGYFPLYEFTSIKKNDAIMSLWTAPKPLLMALFQNEEVVQEVLETRKEIYNARRRKTLANSQPSDEPDLKLQFSSYIRDIDPQHIDFQISGTRPPDMPKSKNQN